MDCVKRRDKRNLNPPRTGQRCYHHLFRREAGSGGEGRASIFQAPPQNAAATLEPRITSVRRDQRGARRDEPDTRKAASAQTPANRRCLGSCVIARIPKCRRRALLKAKLLRAIGEGTSNLNFLADLSRLNVGADGMGGVGFHLPRGPIWPGHDTRPTPCRQLRASRVIDILGAS